MQMNEIVNMITQSAVSVVVIAYFMYRDFKFMGQLQTTLQTLIDTVNTLKELVIHKKDGE